MRYPKSPLALLACLGLGFALAGCGPSADSAAPAPAPGAAPAAKKLTIAVIPKGMTHSYWKAAEAGVKRAAAEFDLAYEWQGPLDESRVAEQVAILNNLATSGVSGILISPCDDKALAPHVRSITKRGIPVSIFDSPLDAKQGTDFVNFVSTDNRRAGEIAAETLVKMAGPTPPHGGEILMIRYTEGSAGTRFREEGFLAVIAKHPQFKVVSQQFTDGSMAGAQRVAEALLGNYVKDGKLALAGVFASNQPTTEGTLNALRSLRGKNTEVQARYVGFDQSELLDQGLESGVVDALIIQDPEMMGYLGVKSLVDHIQGKPVEAFIDTGVKVKTKTVSPAP
jgi:ribose transport system substrate-binding protein